MEKEFSELNLIIVRSNRVLVAGRKKETTTNFFPTALSMVDGVVLGEAGYYTTYSPSIEDVLAHLGALFVFSDEFFENKQLAVIISSLLYQNHKHISKEKLDEKSSLFFCDVILSDFLDFVRGDNASRRNFFPTRKELQQLQNYYKLKAPGP